MKGPGPVLMSCFNATAVSCTTVVEFFASREISAARAEMK
jgi:hypothetical protein